jgi:hypothetical protein
VLKGDFQGRRGVVKFVGPVRFASGNWVGVDLGAPVGKNDGSVQGVRYFSAPHAHGIFIKAAMLQIVEDRVSAKRGACACACARAVLRSPQLLRRLSAAARQRCAATRLCVSPRRPRTHLGRADGGADEAARAALALRLTAQLSRTRGAPALPRSQSYRQPRSARSNPASRSPSISPPPSGRRGSGSGAAAAGETPLARAARAALEDGGHQLLRSTSVQPSAHVHAPPSRPALDRLKTTSSKPGSPLATLSSPRPSHPRRAAPREVAKRRQSTGKTLPKTVRAAASAC